MKGLWALIKANPAVAGVLAALGLGVAYKSKTPLTSKLGGPPPEGGAPPEHLKGMSHVRELTRVVCKAAGFTPDAISWAVNFTVLQAATESGANNYRGLGIPSMFPSWAIPTGAVKEGGKWVVSPDASAGLVKLQNAEAKAARITYERNEERGSLPKSNAPKSQWTFGSGGYFGLLPASGLYAFRSGADFNEFHPFDVFDARRSIVMLLAYMQRLSAYSSFKAQPNNDQVNVLKRGFASPSLMSKPAADRSVLVAERNERNAQKYGIPASFLSRPMPYELKKSRDWVKLIRKVEGR